MRAILFGFPLKGVAHSFDEAKRMAATKIEDKMSELGHGEFGEVIDKFHSHNLAELGVPVEARPRRGEQHLGRHGYTLRHRSGAVTWPPLEI